MEGEALEPAAIERRSGPWLTVGTHGAMIVP
jgi:hypothetical protein